MCMGGKQNIKLFNLLNIILLQGAAGGGSNFGGQPIVGPPGPAGRPGSDGSPGKRHSPYHIKR